MRFTFCPDCGARTSPSQIDGRERDTCAACSRTFYDNAAPAVGIVLISDKKILLARRAGSILRGEWMIPGGFIEVDEPVEAAVVREAREELGIEARISRILDASSGFEVPGRPVLGVYYEIARVSGELKPGSDVDALEFYDLCAVPDLPFDGDRRVITIVKREQARL